MLFDYIKTRGLRLNPGPQVSGSQTIQQAIYQAHNSACGQNMIIYNPIGVTYIRFIELKALLDEAMSSELSIAIWTALRSSATNFLLNSSLANKMLYLDQLGKWAESLFESIPAVVVDGYNYHMTVYDSSGLTIWDSNTPTLFPVQMDPMTQIINYTRVPLVLNNPFAKPYFNLYGASYNISYVPYIDEDLAVGRLVLDSAFLLNQSLLPETQMANGSLLTDPANTRTFGFKYYGFSARQQVPTYAKNEYFGDLGYYCCYLAQLYSAKSEEWPYESLIENIFCRIGLEQSVVQPPP